MKIAIIAYLCILGAFFSSSAFAQKNRTLEKIKEDLSNTLEKESYEDVIAKIIFLHEKLFSHVKKNTSLVNQISTLTKQKILSANKELEENIQKNNDFLKKSTNQILTINQEMSSVKKGIKALTKKSGENSNNLETSISQISILTNKLPKIGQKILLTENKNKVLEKNIQKNNVDLKNLAKKTEQKILLANKEKKILEENIQKNNGFLKKFASQISTLTNKLPKIDDSLEKSASQISTLTNKLPKIDQKILSANKERKVLQGNIQKNSNSLKNSGKKTELYYLAKALIFYGQKKYDDALPLLENCPSIARAQNLIGVIYMVKKEYQQAINYYSKAILIDPKSATVFAQRGKTYHALKEFQLAEKDYISAIKISPKYIYPHTNRALAYLAQNKYAKAISDYKKVIELEPKNKNMHQYKIGLVYLQEGKYKLAINQFSLSLKKSKLIPLSDIYKASAHLQKALCYEKLEERDKAIQEFDKAISYRPNYDSLFLTKAKFFRRAKEYNNALKIYNKRINYDSKNSTFYEPKASLFYVQKQYDEAVKIYDEAITNFPDSGYLHYRRGRAYMALRKTKEAILDWKQAIYLGYSGKNMTRTVGIMETIEIFKKQHETMQIGNRQGGRTFNVANYFSSEELKNGYMHVKLPYQVTKDKRMYHITVTGYSFSGKTKIINLTFAGYSYKGKISDTQAFSATGAFSPTQYIGSDNHVYLRFSVENTYYLTYVVDSMLVGNGRIIKPGEITIKYSTKSKPKL